MLKNHFVPSHKYKFPVHSIDGHSRHFQRSWLEQYKGLVYSESEDGGYCKFCVLFGKCGPTMKEFGNLVSKPLVDFKRATEKLNRHFHASKGKKFHQRAMEEGIAFVAVMENPSVGIDFRLSTERSRIAARNRLIIQSIAETVIFLGRQGLSFRGHRDDSSVIQDEVFESDHGNFLALLQFRVQAGDSVLEQHLQTAAGNALYTSKTIQNEVITICGDLIRGKILQKIKKASFFTVIADEATDASNDEQLSVSIRFVDDGKPSERFLAFHKCVSGVSGEAIADNILSKLGEWQLDPKLLRGQSYDGAGAMSGKSKGAAARISLKYPKAVYAHCASHKLNLCIMKCCKIREIDNIMQTADTVSRFFNNSPKRQLALEEWIDSILPFEKRKKLKEMCRTRWIERLEAFKVFVDLFLRIFSCLEPSC